MLSQVIKSYQDIIIGCGLGTFLSSSPVRILLRTYILSVASPRDTWLTHIMNSFGLGTGTTLFMNSGRLGNTRIYRGDIPGCVMPWCVRIDETWMIVQKVAAMMKQKKFLKIEWNCKKWMNENNFNIQWTFDNNKKNKNNLNNLNSLSFSNLFFIFYNVIFIVFVLTHKTYT